MSRDFEELDFAQTPLGDLFLRRRRIRSLDNLEIFEVKLGEAFLMSSLFHVVEEALAHRGLGDLPGSEWDVVVGGLGLGYTACAALEHPEVRSLLVIDALAQVISWHRRGLVPLGPRLTSDARVKFLEADFFALAQSARGFAEGRQFHAVLLDIDHSPRDLLAPGNASFYTVTGLQALAAQLHPAGVFALWSDEAPDEEFLALLCEVFPEVRAEVVAFPNPVLDCTSRSTVYVAQKAAT